MALGFFMFSLCDVQAKFLTGEFHPMQVVWARQLGLFVGVAVLLAFQGLKIFSTRRPVLQVLRGLLAAASAALFISGIKFIPLADAAAVTFVAPFIVTILAALILREKVGLRRWSAVAIGFLGAMIVIRPGLGVMHPAVLLIVAGAAAFALRQVVSRWVASHDKTMTTVAYTATASVLALSIPLPFVWVAPTTAQQWALLGGMAFSAAIGEVFIIKALEIGQATVLAPMQYSIMIWATLWGWIVFAQLPDLWTWFGTFIIIATGLYIVARERRIARASRPS
ncbi:DMT family transporter [Ruegeria pomeroyi]|nr:DMT family transporter [Ruegeria pomeroyi]MCE8534752.1 DMT family transporter [Ruegeria pomeroyi]